uniref:Inter-alpha-trypsin inhibitor heavy chain family member 6 n=1 Tax=Pelusios castaneus TaxID=367368 RepID=A0A8C8ST78_9SAUR
MDLWPIGISWESGPTLQPIDPSWGLIYLLAEGEDFWALSPALEEVLQAHALPAMAGENSCRTRLPGDLTMTSFSIRSTIISRYASTHVQTVLRNTHPEAKEAIFDLDLPASAFISNFTITINNKFYVAEVKEKHQAKKMYDEARRQGKTAAHVGTRDRETEKFRVSASVSAGNQVSFELSYEELLHRHLGKYQHAVSVRPRQVVGNLTVEVSISERTGIDYVHVLPLRDADVPPSTRVEKGSHCAWIVFTPTPQEQAAFSSAGIMGDFVVQYDVALPDVAGDVQIYNGYFVHYFAPRGLLPVQKNVVFVIDVSGSMYGTKMKQARGLWGLGARIPGFSPRLWEGRGVQWKTVNQILLPFLPSGTDINKALLEAASVLTQSPLEPSPQRIPLLIFLTDGEATAGVTSGTRILVNARQALRGIISLFGLAFGDDADYGLLRRLALENRGVARRIYEDSDAALQLTGFYDEIASPLLYDVALSYRDGIDLTRTLFPNYFHGSELVVAGRVAPGATEFHIQTVSHGHNGQLSLENDISANATEAATFGCSLDLGQIGRFVQRLWAYFTIQDLLQARFRSNDTTARRLLIEKATNLSLKYNFVTPVTSLVVVKLEEEENATAQAIGTPGTPLATMAAPRATKIWWVPDSSLFPLQVRQPRLSGEGQGQQLGFPLPFLHPLLSFAVDGDPHFVVQLSGSLETLCFTLDGHPGDVLQLVTDPAKDGIVVLVGPPRLRYAITVTLQGVALKGEGALDLPFGHPAWVSHPGLGIRVGLGANVTLQLGTGLEFVVQRHQYGHPSYLQRDHLGFYVVDGSGLSAQAHGLLGKGGLWDSASFPFPHGIGLGGWRGLLKDSPLPAHQAPCWLVKGNDVTDLLGGAYSTFVIPPST